MELVAITNNDRVGKALEALREGLSPFVQREVDLAVRTKRLDPHYVRTFGEDPARGGQPLKNWDAAGLLAFMWDTWNDVFRRTLGQSDRSLVSELRACRNRWAHQERFSSDDAYRALDSVSRLLTSVSAQEAREVEQIKTELLRLRFEEQTRSARRKQTGSAIRSSSAAGLTPWRDVITPHEDVTSGHFQRAEFAADLLQVHLGEGTAEYRDPTQFFRRTFLTESLKQLLIGAIRRLRGQGGDPVVQLQTNFGGGKTHSMLALYHLFSGTDPANLEGVHSLVQAAGATTLPIANRIVLVGNKISPGNPATKSDGTTVRTLWGELAWQLGGKAAFERIAADDRNATNPGDALRRLFEDYGPCLILIDEWVAYARQLHDDSDLPAGSFETQFTFAQALTEAAKAASKCLLVVSLPASDTSVSPHTQADDAEVGGQRGREALVRLRNVVGRVESSWRPASAEESFEIVRRRLFEPLTAPAQFKNRDVVARSFADLYRKQHQEFPADCREPGYEKRIKSAYPIHPEVFDRLYSDWSTLVKFQRTRGVLRLMAAVVHSLWEKGDKNPLVLPASISIDDASVQMELTRNLTDHWAPVIDVDVDGASALSLRIDQDLPNLGRYAACRRVARSIFLGSAPTLDSALRGIEDRRIKLGCVMPGESPAVFGDALHRLAGKSTYLYQDGPRYWYATQPTVTKLADDRAEVLIRDPDKVIDELSLRLRGDLREVGDFNRIHALPESGQDVPDDLDSRLVVLGTKYAYTKEAGNPASVAASEILAYRGSSPRQNQNTLVFLAPDKVRLQDLDEAIRRYLAWKSILAEREQLDLSRHQIRQAETQLDAASNTVGERIPETYRWLLVPTQSDSGSSLDWSTVRLSGSESLAVRASRKLKHDELLITSFAASRLRMELDRVPLWRGNHVQVKQLAEDFARYIYLPRLKSPNVLLAAIRDGVELLDWYQDGFAYADIWDEHAKRYRGLKVMTVIELLNVDSLGILVKPEIARKQLEQTDPPKPPPKGPSGPSTEPGNGPNPRPPGPDQGPPPSPKHQPKRFHGRASLNVRRVGLDASRIAEEVVAHLAGIVEADLTVTLEIEAVIPDGAPDDVVRTVTENARTLNFSDHGFEKE